MPDNRLTLTIEAQNLAQAAFKQFQTDVRQSNEALQKTGQAGRQSSAGIKVYRDELGRFHDAVTGRYVSAARLLKEGFTEVERGADDSTEAIKRANPVITRMRREFNLLGPTSTTLPQYPVNSPPQSNPKSASKLTPQPTLNAFVLDS